MQRHPSFSIRSVASDREVAFSKAWRDHFTVEIRGSGVAIAKEVDAYTDPYGLGTLLSRLASYQEPWEGECRWQSLEGDFSLTAECSSLGKVRFTVDVKGSIGGPEEWRATSQIVTELGQLPAIASRAEPFFRIVAGEELNESEVGDA